MAKQLCEYAWMQLALSAPFPVKGRMRTTTCVPESFVPSGLLTAGQSSKW